MIGRNDPILDQTSKTTNQIINRIYSVPASQRARTLDQLLNSVQYGLSTRVRKVSNHLGRQGVSSRESLRTATRLVLADWALDHFKKLGTKKLRGDVVGLGANAGQTLLNIGQGLTCGIAASPEAQALAARLAGGGTSTGAMTSNAGFSVARNICPGGGGGAPAPAPELPPPEPTSSIPWVPIMIGGTLLVGIVVFVKMRS